MMRFTALTVCLVAATLALRAQDPPSAEKVRAALRIAEFDTALREAEALAQHGGPDAESQALLGDALWGNGLFDEADAAYRRALTVDAAFPRARFGEARSLASRSRLTEALERVQGLVAAGAGDPDVHALAASIQERLARYDAAAASYEAYASLVPAEDPTPSATARARAQFLRSFGERQPLVIQQKADAVHAVPFKLVRNKVVVQGRLNGYPVEWVVDTGAERTGVSFALAVSARLRAVASTLTAGVGPASLRRVQLARADTLEIGSLRIRNVPVSVRAPSGRGAGLRWQGESLSPLALGLSVVVDYKRRQVLLARELPQERADIVLPLRMHRLPLVRGTLNDRHPAYFVVDTGGEVISISSETADALGMTPPRRIPLRVYGLSGLDETAFLLPGVNLDFEEIAYRNIGLAVLNLRAPSVLLGFQVGGIVGHKFLGDYRVAFDVARSELRLSR